MPSKYSVQHFHWRNMKISVVFSNVQNYSLKNLQHNLCVQCSELVREVCEEKGHCHYYTVIWLFCESHTRSTTVDHQPGEQRGNHKVFHDFLMISRFFHLLLLWVTPNINQETINTRRTERQPRDFPWFFWWFRYYLFICLFSESQRDSRGYYILLFNFIPHDLFKISTCFFCLLPVCVILYDS